MNRATPLHITFRTQTSIFRLRSRKERQKKQTESGELVQTRNSMSHYVRMAWRSRIPPHTRRHRQHSRFLSFRTFAILTLTYTLLFAQEFYVYYLNGCARGLTSHGAGGVCTTFFRGDHFRHHSSRLLQHLFRLLKR